MFFRSGSSLMVRSTYWMENLFEKVKLEDLSESNYNFIYIYKLKNLK